MPATASAGECPADKMVANAQGPGATANVGVTDKVLAEIDLAKEPTGIKDRHFRLRRLVVQPGGTVAWHSHEDRPALIHIVSGTIVEYRGNCAVPIVHHAGETARETHMTKHWWKNTTKKPVVLLAADLLRDPNDKHM
jgi:quercetin dioxygenase-like cupin family protein